MNKQYTKKHIIKDVLGFFLIGLLLFCGYQLVTTIKGYEDEIAERDEIIKKYEKSEALNCDREKEYSTVIKQYTSEGALIIGDKKYSLRDLVSYISQRNDSIYNLNVSLENLKVDLENLNIQYKHLKDNCVGKYTYGPAEKLRIDSGLMLLPYYRDKLGYDTSKKEWHITITK